jgi:SNF2 family DNA or RNA helicase
MKVLKEYIHLYDHQKDVLKLMDENDTYGIYLEQGLGKTIIGLCDITRKVYKFGIKRILILAPVAVKGAWERDIDHLTDEAKELIKDRITITNYEQLQAKAGEKLKKTKWDYIILDEGHRIKDKSTNTHKIIIKMGLHTRFKYILTGTPVVNGNLINYWSYDTFMHTEINRGRAQSSHFGTITNFKNSYCILDQWYNPKAYIKVDEILDYVKRTSIRLYKKDCLDLPEMLEPEIYEIPMGSEQLKFYKEMAKTSTILDHDLLAENGVSRLNYLRQIATGFLYLEDKTLQLSNQKINVLKDYLKDSEDPVVIFYNFTEEGDQIEKLLKSLKIKYHKLDGKTKPKDKSNWKLFQKDDSRVYLSQIQSGARGIDLFKSSVIIYYSLPLSSEVFEQSKARIHRAGMKNIPASYIIFTTKNTVELEIYDALKNYMDFNEKMFDIYIENYTRGQKV